MINRLQFVHNNTLFKTRDEAIEFLNNQYYKQVTRPSLYAEPVVLKYGDEKEPNVILAIGATGSGSSEPTKDSSYFIIDAQGIKDSAKEKYDEIEKALAKLAFVVADSDTLELEKVDEDGVTTLRGNVKVPEKALINDENVKNVIKTNKDGLYSYVSLNFDDKTNTFKFQVNEEVTEFSIPTIEGGKYDIEKEAIVLTYTDGTTKEIDVDDLIDEWTTEGEASTTPIVLTKEKHTDKTTDINDRNEDQWKDVLKADVRIVSGYDSDKKHNILKKTTDGRYLYVSGTADNIYYKDGKNVKEAIESISTEVSTANTNNIIFKDFAKNGDYNGIAANVEMEYSKETNVLVFKHSDGNGSIVREEFKLNSASFIDDISYDTVNQSITIRYKDVDGKVQKTDIDLSTLLDDWVTNSDGHSVELKKQLNKGNKDILSADVKLTEKTDDNYQIIEEREHRLYVKGTADNIHYNNGENVKDAIDRLENELTEESDNLKQLSASSYFEVGETDTVVMSKNDAVSSHTVTSNVKVSKKDKNSILVDGNNGLYVSLDYDPRRNVITVSDTNDNTHQRDIQLNSISVVEYMKYDPSREEIVIAYKSNASSSDTSYLEVPITSILNEWVPVNGGHNVRMVRTTHSVDGADELSSDVILATEGNYSDNLIKESTMTAYGEEMKGLYVSGKEIEASARTISKEESKIAADKAVADSKAYTDSVHDTVKVEINNAKEEAVNESNAYTENKISAYDHNLHDELGVISANTLNDAISTSNAYTDTKVSEADAKSRTYASEAERNSKAYADDLRQASKDDIASATTEFRGLITTESADRHREISDLDKRIDQEVNDRIASDNLINGNLSAETKTRETADATLKAIIDKEVLDRSTADTSLLNSITNESTARENADSDLDSKITMEIELRTQSDKRLDQEINDRIASDNLINGNLSAETKTRETADATLKESIEKEVLGRSTADASLLSRITNESTIRENADNNLDSKITRETELRTQSDTALKDEISSKVNEAKAYTDTKSSEVLANAKTYADTKSDSLSAAIKSYVDSEVSDITLIGSTTDTVKVSVSGNEITSDVRIASGNNNRILHNADGLYVGDISSTYDAQTNTLTINGLDGNPVLTQKLNSASFIDSITYDEQSHILSIVYHTTDGSVTSVPVNLTGLIKDTKTDETSNSPIEITVTPTVENGVSVNKVKGDINIADNVEGNILKTVTKDGKGALYADASVILNDIKELSTTFDSLSGKTDGINDEINTIETSIGLDNEGHYIPSDKPYISGATSLSDADKKLADAVSTIDNSISNLMKGSNTYSVNVFTEKDTDTEASLLKADVRLSLAKDQNEAELTRTTVPYANAYEGNLLQILKAESEGSTIELVDKVNGLYFGGSIDYGMMVGDNDING